MSFHQERTTDSPIPTNITHNVSLSFEIGTSNISAPTRNSRGGPTTDGGEATRPQSDDRNGMSQDNSHGSNRDAGSGYSSDVRKILGHPNRLRPVSNGVATVQEESSSDVVSGDEAHQQNVNLHGEPRGSCHATRLSTIADPTIGLQIHPFIRKTTKIIFEDVDTIEKENQLLQVSYPRSEQDYTYTSPWEVKAISVLKTGLSPSLRKRDKCVYANARNSINCYRRSKGIPIIPYGMFDLVSPILVPAYEAYHPSKSNIEEYYKKLKQYKEDLRLQNLELEVIEWITANKVPKMGDDEREKLVKDLTVINDFRQKTRRTRSGFR